MEHRYLVGGGAVLFGVFASLEGIARLFSGTNDLYRGGKHPWLKGFFILFGPYAPHASAALSLLIGAAFFYMAFRVLRIPKESLDADPKEDSPQREK